MHSGNQETSAQNGQIPSCDRLISLHREILSVAEKEREAIKGKDLDALAKHSQAIDEIIEQIDGINKSGSAVLSKEQGAEVESIIRKILAAREENAKHVSAMRDNILDDMFAHNKSRNAHNSYITEQSANKVIRKEREKK